MKSQRIQLPKYDLPIRLRPVRFPSCPLIALCSMSFAVVPPLHIYHHDLTRTSGIYQLLPLFAIERQVSALHLLLCGNGSILLCF
jgi:hypothetical protein